MTTIGDIVSALLFECNNLFGCVTSYEVNACAPHTAENSLYLFITEGENKKIYNVLCHCTFLFMTLLFKQYSVI